MEHPLKEVKTINTSLGFTLCGLLALGFVTGCNVGPAVETKPMTNPSFTGFSLRTSAGATVPFTSIGVPQLEIVNDRLNVALTSQEGMIFQLTEIPAKGGVAARRYRGDEFRTLLLHSGFQEEAATGDGFKETAKLEIIKHASEKSGALAEIQYAGKLRAGSETLDVRFQYSVLLPASQKFLIPNQESSTPQPQ